LLLNAHYDSSAAGPGAGDDGAGVATLLEVASILKGEPLRRPVTFLFNEGEELGLVGARAFLQRDPLAARVDSLINLEARGVKIIHQTNVLGPCCADHLEDMMFPTSTWGKEFAIVRSQSRGTNELDVLRIMAQKPNTTITFNPAPTGTCAALQPGQFCQVKIAGDTSIVASEPILIGHYLESAIWQDPFFGGAVGSGDPSMAIAVPTEQYRKDYTVLVPSQYTKSYMSISAPATGAVLVDGLPIQLTAFAGNYRGARHQVTAGQHKISCPNGCGVVVYGYSDAVSFMFAGGLDLKKIVIN
jgi:hypothetical protein